MNSPYQEICDNYEKPESWDLWSSYKKHEKFPNNHTIIESFFSNALFILCLYLSEQGCKKYIKSIEMSKYISNYSEVIEDILQSFEVHNENKGLKIYIGKTLNNDIHKIKVETYDYVFSILGSQDPIPGVIYLQDYIETHEKNAD